ncbi:MAG: rhomboid family intramembrane serine protease [Planctomycetota bacterium]
MLPIATSIKPKQTPYMNYFIIAANIVVFLLSMHLVLDPRTGKSALDLRPWAEPFMLMSDYPSTWQFVTYAFLHGGLMHIIGNMFFLHMFGNNVNDNLGGAVFSGIGYTLISSNPILGASGAVAAVTGAYLVLFPKTLVTVVYWFIFIDTVEIRAMYFIAFKLIFWDNILAADPNQNIAYNAHLAGYGFGILSIMGLLSVGLIDGGYNDFWYMIRQWNRRRNFRDAVSDGYDPHQGNLGRKTVSSSVEDKQAVNQQQQQIMELRARISSDMSRRNASQAVAEYLQLLKIDASQILPQQLQLDIANQLMAESKWQPSADAYRKFLARYRSYEHAEQVHLMLGLLCGRYLERPQEAMEHLNIAKDKLSDPGQKTMCQQELDRLQSE